MKVAVLGLGYVGTVTAACLATNGHDVCGADVDAARPPRHLIDLSGRLGTEVEALPGYEGLNW